MATETGKNGKSGSKDISVDDLSAQIDLLKADIANLTDTIGALAKSKSAEAGKQAKQKAEDLGEAAKEKVLETQLKTEEFIRTQPATALGIAAGIGFLVGLFTARR